MPLWRIFKKDQKQKMRFLLIPLMLLLACGSQRPFLSHHFMDGATASGGISSGHFIADSNESYDHGFFTSLLYTKTLLTHQSYFLDCYGTFNSSPGLGLSVGKILNQRHLLNIYFNSIYNINADSLSDIKPVEFNPGIQYMINFNRVQLTLYYDYAIVTGFEDAIYNPSYISERVQQIGFNVVIPSEQHQVFLSIDINESLNNNFAPLIKLKLGKYFRKHIFENI